MKSYKELNVRYLKSHKKRSALTILGIVLSVALLCAAGIMGESLKNMMLEGVKEMHGNYHVAYKDINKSQLNMLQENAKIKEVGYYIDTAYSSIAAGQNIMLVGCNKSFLDMIYVSLDKGRLPEKQDEIALEQWVLDNLPGKPGINSTVSLDLYVLNNPLQDKKDITSLPKMKRNFKITGIFKNKERSMYGGVSIAMITPETGKSILGNEHPSYTSFILINDKLDMQSSIKDIQRSIELKDNQVSQNTAYLTAIQQGRSNSNNNAVMAVEYMAIAIIIIATIAVIYNAFHISVIERIHQFGVLRSIGTTPSQIRNIVVGEAIILSIIGIPIGLLCGIAAFKIVIGIFAMRNPYLFGSMKVIILPYVLYGTAILGFLTVILSAFGPALSASRVSPMEAILNTAKLNKGKLKRRKHRILKFLFSIEGVMASENLKRNKKRFIVTVFSMSIGIALFVFFYSFMNFLRATVDDNAFHKDFVVDRPFSNDNKGYTQTDYDEIAAITGVKNVYRVMQKNEVVTLKGNQINTNYKNANKTNYDKINADLYGYRDMELQLYKKNIIYGKLNEKDLNAENGVIISEIVDVGGKDIKASSLKLGDEIQLTSLNSTGESKTVNVKVMGILDKVALGYNAGNTKYTIITTEEVFKKVTGNNDFARFDIETDKKADLETISTKLEGISKRAAEGRMQNYSGNADNEALIEMGVMLYGIVAVISLIGALNIINTISTNLILRIREFGTLRAVGMTAGQMKKMIRLEGIIYGLYGAFYGGIVGCGLSRLLYNSINQLKPLPWKVPYAAIIAAAIVSIIIGLSASAVPMKRITGMDVVDAIRMEE